MSRTLFSLPRPAGPTSRRRLLALSFTAVLAACGGSDDASPAPTPPPAAVAPTVTLDPASLQVGEGASAQFSVGASGTATLTYQWLLDGSGPIAGATTPSLSVGPVGLHDHGKRFGVNVSNGAGAVTSALATLSVSERTWSTPTLPASGATGAQPAQSLQTPAVVVDSHGHSHMLLSQEDDAGHAMWVAFKAAGASSFGAFTRLSATAPSVYTLSPSLAADASGHVIAVWRGALPNESSQVRAAVFVPSGPGGGSWGAEQNVSDATQFDVSELAVAAAGDGSFEVVYVATPTAQAHRNVVARRASVNAGVTSWSDEAVLDDITDGAAVGVKVAGNSAGQVLVAWNESRTFSEAHGAARSGSAAWSAPFDIGGLANENLQPASVAIDGQGRGVVAMMGDQTRVHLRRFAFGGNGFGFTGAAQYVTNFTHSHVPPVAVAGIDGSFEVLSVHNLGRQLSRVRFDGASWSELQAVLVIDSAEGLDVISGLQAGVDGAGNLIVTWSQNTQVNSYPLQRARRYHAGLAQWREMVEFFTTERVRGNQTALAVHTDGRALALVVLGEGVAGQAVFD